MHLHLVDEDLAWLEEQKQFSTWQVILVVKMVVTSANTDTQTWVWGGLQFEMFWNGRLEFSLSGDCLGEQDAAGLEDGLLPHAVFSHHQQVPGQLGFFLQSF